METEMILIEEPCWDDIEVSVVDKGWTECSVKLDQSGDQIYIQMDNVPAMIEALKKILR